MNTFKDFITEKRSKKVIVVDVQPAYQPYISFDIELFGDFLLENREILYFYNGESMGFDDSPRHIADMFMEESEYSEEAEMLYDKLMNKRQTIWDDKGYAFFRAWMDEGADVSFIMKAIRWMMEMKVNDSREIDEEEWLEKFPNDFEDYMIDDPLIVPDIPLRTLKKFSGAYLTGGGKNECLAEVKILMDALNIKYTLVKEFIY